MRKAIFLICLLLTASAVRAGRIVTDSINSQKLGAVVKVNVYLPSGFDRSQQQYPVVYLLHGLTDTYIGILNIRVFKPKIRMGGA